MKQSRWAKGMWLPACVLATLVLWLGCEQKGEISPTASNKRVLTFIDTVVVDPSIIPPGETAAVHARILSELNEPAQSENVRFSVTRGTLPDGRVDTTVLTDHLGWARTSVTAPEDTGIIVLRTELPSMSEQRVTDIRVSLVTSEEGVLTVWTDADTLYADNGFSRTFVHARLRNEAHNPIPGAVISFSTNVGSVTQTGVTDSLQGVAHATLVSTTETGAATVVARYGSARDSARVLFLEPVAATLIELTSSRTQITAGTDSTVITARVFGANNLPVADNTLVTFSTTQGTLRNLTARTVNGAAASVLYASPATGMATVTATTGGTVTGSTNVTFLPGPTAAITLSASDDTLFADNNSQAIITARLMDAYGNNVAQGTSVSFTALGGTVTEIATVDVNGRASATFRAGLTAGPAAVTATQGTVQSSVSIYLQSTSAASVALTADPMQLAANGAAQSNLRATVLDAQSRPVSDGTPVTFYARRGTISAMAQGAAASRSRDAGPFAARSSALKLNAREAKVPSAKSHLDESPTASIFTTTTVNGYAYALLTSSTAAGADTVSASVNSLSAMQILAYLAGPAARINVTPAVNALPADGLSSTTITCQVTDAFGNAVSSGMPIGLTATMGQIIPSQGYTDESGAFVTNLVTSRQRGVCAIVATSGSATGYSQVTFNAPSVASAVMSSDATSLLANGISQAALTVTASDANGLPVQGASVVWSLGAGYGSLVIVSAVTDSLGRASALFYSFASRTDEQEQVTAYIGTLAATKTIRMLGVTLQAWTDATQLPADGSATTNANVLIRETTSGQAVVGASVRFAASSGSIPLTGTTNGSGIASALYRSASQPGNAEIMMVYGDTLRAQTGLRLTGIEADTVIVNLSHQELLADGLSSTSVTAVVFNEGGQPVANTPVAFSVVGAGYCVPSTALTNSNGIATAAYYSAALTSDLQVAVEAAIDRDNDEKPIVLRGVRLEAFASELSLPADGASTSEIRVELRRSSTQVAVSDATIQLGTTRGTIPATVITDSSGVARAMFTSGVEPGTANVFVRYGNVLADTVSLSLFQPSASFVSVAAQQRSLLGNGQQSTLVTTAVLDQRGAPMSSQIVNWSLNGFGTLYSTVGVTDANGVASNLVTAPASVQDRLVIVTVNTGTAVGVDTIAARGVTIQVTATPEMIIADGSSASTIRAHVRETTSSVAIYNGTITFGSTLGTIPNTSVTDASGLASVLLRSSTATGTATVTASYGNILSDQVTVTLAASTPTTLSLTASPTVLLADNISTSTLTAVVTDQSGNPVPNGTQIRFSIPPQSGSLENLRTTQAGVAANTLTSSSAPDTVQVTAWAEGNPSARDSVTVVYRVGPPTVVTLSAQSDTLPANGIAVDTITAHVTDAVGHVLANVEVRFTTTIGNITSSRVTDASGNARVAFSSSQTGTAQVTATAGTASNFYTIYLIPGSPNSIAMDYLPNSVGVRGSGRNETLLITATVRDANNNAALDGTPVFFNIASSPGNGDFLSSTGPIPTINGRATVSYNSGTRSGSVRIRAVCNAISAVSTEILVYAGPPYIEDVSFGCETSHMSLAPSPCSMFGMDVVGDSVTLVALIGDRYNNPVTPGTAVYFTTSGGVITTATGYTDSLGFARVTLFSGNPLPTVARWTNTLSDPNVGGPILCTPAPTRPGMAKILATSAGVDANGDSVTVWATTNVIFEYSQPILQLRSTTVNGDPTDRSLYIGENAVITVACYDPNFWPLVYGSTINFSASYGLVYPSRITVGCPGDTLFAVSFFNNRTITDDDAASPVLITVDTRQGDAYTFTETFTLLAALPPSP